MHPYPCRPKESLFADDEPAPSKSVTQNESSKAQVLPPPPKKKADNLFGDDIEGDSFAKPSEYHFN